MRCVAAALLALTFAAPAYADHDRGRLWLHLASEHWIGGDYNEENEGLAVELHVTGPWSIELGGYENSAKRQSRYGLGLYEFFAGADWRVQAGAGFVDGYDGQKWTNGEGIGPMLALTVEYQAVRAMVLPGVVGFSVRLAQW